MMPLEESVPGAARAHEAGTDRAHLYALARELGPQAFREAHEGELARAVRQEMRHADLAADGGHVHDAARPAASHLGQDGENGVERPPEVDLHGCPEIFNVHRLSGTYDDGPRIVDEGIDLTELARDARHQALDLVLARHVTRHGAHAPAGGGELLARPLERRLVPSTNRHACSLRHELAGDDQAESA